MSHGHDVQDHMNDLVVKTVSYFCCQTLEEEKVFFLKNETFAYEKNHKQT